MRHWLRGMDDSAPAYYPI